MRDCAKAVPEFLVAIGTAAAAIASFVVVIVVVVQKVHNLGRPDVSVLSNQTIDGIVLPEFSDPRCQNDQFSAVGNRHSCPVDGLVAQPGRMEFVRIQIHDHFGRRSIKHGKIDGHAQPAGLLVTFDGVPDEESPEGAVGCHHRQNIPQIQVGLQKILAGTVQYGPQRIFGPAHHVFHPVDGPDEMREIDCLQTAHAHKQILVEIGHAHDFVRDNLSDGDYQGCCFGR
mmetsp:Transcript_1366/g.3043  ORF Transcript_1366/g.3043 Transcript_1366/m.3043 type:complete len:228 (+) Transcript_1366:464-1147(+)